HTFVDARDQNKMYQGKRLGDVITLPRLPTFSYDKFIRAARNVDVVYLTKDDIPMPTQFYEVENTTDMQGALIKFVELQHFHVQFWIVAAESRHRLFTETLKLIAFEGIRNRVKFWSYDDVAEHHAAAARVWLKKTL